MNKKLLKLIASSSVAMTLMAPGVAFMQTNPVVMAAEQSQKTVGMTVYKYSKNHRNMLSQWLKVLWEIRCN